MTKIRRKIKIAAVALLILPRGFCPAVQGDDNEGKVETGISAGLGGISSTMTQLATGEYSLGYYPVVLYGNVAPVITMPELPGGHALAVGYRYQQHWITTDQLLQEFYDHRGAWAHQPFPLGLMARDHQWTVAWQYGAREESWQLGLWAKQMMQLIGSSYGQRNDPRLFDQAVPLGQRSIVQPWLGVTLLPAWRTIVALDFREVDYFYHRDRSYRSWSQPLAAGPLSWFLLTQLGEYPHEAVVEFSLGQQASLSASPQDDRLRRTIEVNGFWQLNAELSVALGGERFWEQLLEPNYLGGARLGALRERGQGWSIFAESTYAWNDHLYLSAELELAKGWLTPQSDLLHREFRVGIEWRSSAQMAQWLAPPWRRRNSELAGR